MIFLAHQQGHVVEDFAAAASPGGAVVRVSAREPRWGTRWRASGGVAWLRRLAHA